MASVSQTIDSFKLGVSKQPDSQLIPGQLKEIINATPDLVEGLPKRGGSQRVGTNPLSNVQCNGTFFNYFRDTNEGSYIGQVDPLGRVRMWCTQDIKNSAGTTIHTAGSEIFVHYDELGTTYTATNYNTTNAAHTAISSYLTPSSITATEDIQALTINDTTFFNNRNKVVSTGMSTGSTYTRNKSYTIATNRINTSTDVITVAEHGFSTGDLVYYIESGSGLATPLANGTAYYVIKLDNSTLKLATSATNASNGTAIDITATGNDNQYLEYGFGIVTITKVNHKFAVGDSVNIDFSADNAGNSAPDGDYRVATVIDKDTFTVTDSTSLTGMNLIDDPTDPACILKPLTEFRLDPHYAFVDLLRTENGRQYSLNLHYDNDTTREIKVATRLKIVSTTQPNGAAAAETGHCPGIGTQVFAVSAKLNYSGTSTVSVNNSSGGTITSDRDNLIFRITALGQQGSNPEGNFDDANLSAAEYVCVYNNRVDLLHGGEGWEEGDTVTVKLDSAVTTYNFVIKVDKVETVNLKASIKAVRPEPTPFDADTAVSPDTILGGIQGELPSNAGWNVLGDGTIYKPNVEVIGNGFYITIKNAAGTSLPFTLNIPDKDLMRVMQSTVDNVAELPNQCKHGYIVKVTNSRDADEDDYYLKFVGENNKDGPGSWVECAEPGIESRLNADTMPHVLQRQPIDTNGDGVTDKIVFLVKSYDWGKRNVGDNTTNPLPTFADGSSKINKILFFRNRLAFLSGENVILSRPGDLVTPSFFANTALAVSAIDPIDISSSSTYPSDLFDGIEIPAGLVVFSTNQQFLLATDAEVLNPDTAKFQSISHYSYDKNISPISLGTSIGYVDNTSGYCRFMEMQQVQREQEPVVVETSKVVHEWLPTGINHLINSPENGLVFFQHLNTGFDSTYIYGFKYQDYGERKQAAWFRWRLDTGHEYAGGIRYTFIIDDSLFILNSDNFLMRIYLAKGSATGDPRSHVVDRYGTNSANIPVYLDNWKTITGGVYDSTTRKTTFTNGVNGCVFDWHNHISDAEDSASSEELFLQYTEASDPTSGSATWVTAGKIIPVNESKPAGVNNYSVELSCPIQAKGEIAFRLYQPTNTSYTYGGGSVASMDTYGIMTLKYLKTDGTTHSTLTMSDTNNHLAKSHAVGVKATNSSPSGTHGGFNTGADYLWFSAEVDNNIGDGRYVILPKINVASNYISKIEIAAHVGNNTNGGEWPDIPSPVTNADLYAIGFEHLPEDFNSDYSMIQKVEDLIKGYQFKVSGDWSNKIIYLGFHYGVYIEFPEFYFTQSTGESIKRDLNDYLVIHRLKVHLKESSSISAFVINSASNVTVQRVTPRRTNEYKPDDLPYSTVDEFTIPVYRKNKHTEIYLSQGTSTGASQNDVGPFNLKSVTWEGDYNPKNYRRV